MNKLALIVFGWVVLGMNVQAASFDCGKAQTKVEHLICDNAVLSKLDDELAVSYKAALHDKTQAEAIKQEQKQWMKERNGCADVACVKHAYEIRLQAVSSSSQNSVSHPKQKPRFNVTKGEGYSVCESYAKFLNSLPESDAFPVCHPKLSPDFPDLKEPDWEEMDIPTHLELVYSIEKILSPSYHDRPVDTFAHWKTVYEQQIRNGVASPRLRRVHLALTESSPVETILAYEPDRNACDKWIKKMKYVDANRTNLFLWDEQEQKVKEYMSHITFGSPKELLLFQGKPLTFMSYLNHASPPNPSISGYIEVRHFKQVGNVPYANLPRCQISFEIPRELYERIIK